MNGVLIFRGLKFFKGDLIENELGLDNINSLRVSGASNLRRTFRMSNLSLRLSTKRETITWSLQGTRGTFENRI